MYVLYADGPASLAGLTYEFERSMEPLLAALEASIASNGASSALPELRQYLEVCRWPFRRLEYSFALDALSKNLRPGDRYLDAGCGVTPLAHAVAGWRVDAVACDVEDRLIAGLHAMAPERTYRTSVTYATQDLRATSFADASFDAISCISVLEHLPAPDDQWAIRELLRILRPGGILVMTLDFTPNRGTPMLGRWPYYARRAIELTRDGHLLEIGKGAARKLRAREAVRRGLARQPRSANQCFEIEHLERDILPLLQGELIETSLPLSSDLRSATPAHAKRLWELQPRAPARVSQRTVLPVGFIVRKGAARAH